MGVIQRQSFKNILVNYAGVVIGAISVTFIYQLDLHLYGTIQFWLSTALLMSALLSMGSYTLVSKYFPYFKLNKIGGFLNLVLIYASISVLVVSSILFFGKDYLMNWFSSTQIDFNRIDESIFIIYPVALVLVFQPLFRGQSANLQRVVVPDLLTNFAQKIFVPLVVLASYYSIISKEDVSSLIVGFFVISFLSLIVYVKVLGGHEYSFDFTKKLDTKKYKEMGTYMLFGALNHIGNILTYKIDIIMIGLMIDPTSVGLYSIFLFMATVIEIPSKPIIQITGPMISESFEKNDMEKVSSLYKDSSINLLLAGVFIFGMIWLNIDTVFGIMKKGQALSEIKIIFMFIGVTKIIDVTTALNFSITSYSKYYRYNIVFITILSIVNIILNILFIEEFGLIGVAIATAISMFLFNTIKTLFVMAKFKMHPFTTKMTFPVLIMALLIAGTNFTPTSGNIYLDLVWKSALFAGIYIPCVYYLKISKEANQLVDNTLKKLMGKN